MRSPAVYRTALISIITGSVIVPNLIKIGQTVSEIWRFNGFLKWRPYAVLDLLGPIGTTHDEYLMVSIVVQNLVEIDAVVSLT